ncbi:glycoside hydrolase family 2 protein [Saliphagus infecundisoli]|uniref:Glycoside hydrolase family 2 protein n=1 Tax=Saliphagus infecundisoli TaxID=1849069 RepID=A0ABD5Q9Q1_9EURY|nr:sugar-binding domain-containing protein [Saliphagus infecundisoli]
MVTTPENRDPELSLTGDWEFATDESGDVDRLDPAGDWDDARMVSIPHSWQEEDDLREYTGTAWYRQVFSIDGVDENERLLLTFGAVDFEATVWINGKRVGEHCGGYLPFTLDATDAVEAGGNTVVLRVHDPEDLSEIPHGKQGTPWYTRVSGPWQRVDLFTVPETRVDDVRVKPDLSDDTATVDLTIVGGAPVPEARIEIEREGSTVASSAVTVEDGAASVTFSIPDAEYWRPDSPALYDLTIKLDGGETVDTYEDYFGMRSVSFEDGELFLNGELFTMRGALDQAFYPDTYYRPAELETFEQEIEAAKELGFNLLRKHIKPAHPKFVELADRMGMLVWEEPANPIRYTDRSKELVREQLRGMIDRDFNNPSVIIWSLYNEEWGVGGHEDDEFLWTDEEKQDYIESLYHETKDYDPTRLVCDNSGWAHVATDLNDYHEYFVVPDRVDPWRDRLGEIVENPAGNYGDVRTDPEEAPLLVSEFGTWGLPDVPKLLEASDGEPHWFEHDFLEGMKRPGDVQAKFDASHLADVFDSFEALGDAWQRREFQSIETIIADMRAHKGVSGYVITELTDIEWEFNGILDYERQEKAIYDDFSRINAPVMLHLEPSTPVAWNGNRITADLLLVNDRTEAVDVTVTVDASVPSSDTKRTYELSVDAHDAIRVADVLAFDAPVTNDLRQFELTAEAPDLDQRVARSVTVGPSAEPADTPAVYAESGRLASALAERGYEVANTATDADVSLVTDESVANGPTLVVPDADGRVPVDSGGSFQYRGLDEGDSWNLCASLLYQDLLPEISSVPGWAFEELYPYGYVTDTGPDDDVSIGYTEGWLENGGAVVMTREDRTICTLRVTDRYGSHPVATAIVDRLVAELAE